MIEKEGASRAVDEAQKTRIPPESVDPVALKSVRRRLTVDGNDLSLDGIDEFSLEEGLAPEIPPESNPCDLCVGVYAGKSQKGYVPYNPRKVNQDFLLMHEDAATNTLILGTFDGHGEHGHCISEVGPCIPFHASLSAPAS